MESETSKETLKPSSYKPSPNLLTLEKAIEFGEYDPEYLAQFPEWHQLSSRSQWALIENGLKNCRRILLLRWADIANQLDYSKKPHLHLAAENITKQIKKLNLDEERLQVEYSMR